LNRSNRRKPSFASCSQAYTKGAASFTTWLRVVARNLCFDWHRKVHGRPRPFKSLLGLSALELEVYHCRYERRLSRDETLERLRANWPTTKMDDLIDMELRIENFLNPLQRWILNTRQQGNVVTTSWSDGEDSELVTAELIDPAPSPEAIVLDEQQRTRLHECVAALSDDERLMVRLRFDEELSLEEISRLTGLGDPQRVHRRLAAILQKLFTAMGNRKERKTGDRVREIRQGKE
jgi:RNA polymerase sigma factor (sigma-70 family)